MKQSLIVLFSVLGLASAAFADPLTFRANMLPIFQSRCTLCHQAGGLLPDWTDYKTAFDLRNQLVYHVAVSRDMPMNNVTGMSDDERNAVVQWVDNGAAE